jgi:DNA-binding MarR family transcriptional regulator
VVYPGRKIHEVLPQFVATNVIKPTAGQRAQLLAFVAEEYPAGRSLRELAELTGRTQTAIRRALDELGVPRRAGYQRRVMGLFSMKRGDRLPTRSVAWA